ncbi:MAG: hypothetical protein ACI959_000792 [Limisphaerales bacterium]|jgi:hypothetical protein
MSYPGFKKSSLQAVLLLVLIGLFASDTKAQQNYKVGAGVHLGSLLGLTIRYKAASNFGFEIRAGQQKSGYTAALLGQYEWSLDRMETIQLFTGVGAHVGGFKTGIPDGGDPYRSSYGLDIQAGLEYASPDVPLSLSIDIKPEQNFGAREGWDPLVIGMNVRYLFY